MKDSAYSLFACSNSCATTFAMIIPSVLLYKSKASLKLLCGSPKATIQVVTRSSSIHPETRKQTDGKGTTPFIFISRPDHETHDTASVLPTIPLQQMRQVAQSTQNRPQNSQVRGFPFRAETDAAVAGILVGPTFWWAGVSAAPHFLSGRV